MSSVLVDVKDPDLEARIRTEMNLSGVDVTSADGLNNVMDRVRARTYDAVLVELDWSDDVDVLKSVRDIRAASPETSLFVLGAGWPVGLVVQATREGIDDFFEKPLDIEKLYIGLQRVIERKHLENEVAYLRHSQDVIYQLDKIIAESDHMKSVLNEVRRVAASNASVILIGETGTGKEVVAAAIHFNSARRNRPFVKVNCAALPDTLLESELFGHEKGAFTGAYQRRTGRFEQADGGTIFLDEIADMPQSAQAKILRVLEQREFERLGGAQTVGVDVRVLAASNKDLLKAVDDGQFRQDLYYRLNVVTIQLAPLRDRLDDIKPLADYFLSRFSSQLNYDKCSFSDEAVSMLKSYSWPGNVRQVRNVVERAVIMAGNSQILPEHLALDSPGHGKKRLNLFDEGVMSLDEIEKRAIEQALIQARGVQKDAAKLLDISPRVINYKIQKHGIDVNGLLMGER
ncbi:MAG: sigma-54-dependent Fis family transcriptional regulator [Candidatus Hydrogenedentes bacterium]|nr:sigma-54-dependent Fis family transcriptional regulator [Candidatus Hydrogenedentota bacterium]